MSTHQLAHVVSAWLRCGVPLDTCVLASRGLRVSWPPWELRRTVRAAARSARVSLFGLPTKQRSPAATTALLVGKVALSFNVIILCVYYVGHIGYETWMHEPFAKNKKAEDECRNMAADFEILHKPRVGIRRLCDKMSTFQLPEGTTKLGLFSIKVTKTKTPTYTNADGEEV